MGKVKVKKLNHKEEKKNPFDLRFNKVKHKIVNERTQNKSNPYQSRNRANELRKNSLLVEYKNRNKSGFVKFVDKSSKEEQSSRQENCKQDKKLKKDHLGNNKRKDNAEYMKEMFAKKCLAQAERDKIDNMKDKLDDQWNQLKDTFLQKESSTKVINNKKIDKYDLIFNDLLINPTARYVPKSN